MLNWSVGHFLRRLQLQLPQKYLVFIKEKSEKSYIYYLGDELRSLLFWRRLVSWNHHHQFTSILFYVSSTLQSLHCTAQLAKKGGGNRKHVNFH